MINPDVLRPKGCLGCYYNATEAAFASDVGGFWAGMARDGKPSLDAEWPLFDDVVKGENIVLQPQHSSGGGGGGNFATETHIGRPEACALWDSAPAHVARAEQRPHGKPGWGKRKRRSQN